MKKCFIFYESWQMECCGTAFSVGDTVKWLVYKTNCLNTPVDIGKIDYCYKAHSSEWNNLFVLEGKVENIKILYHKYMTSQDNPNLLFPVDGKLLETDIAKGFDKDLGDMKASGYIVLLNEYTIRPTEKDEVTLK